MQSRAIGNVGSMDIFSTSLQLCAVVSCMHFDTLVCVKPNTHRRRDETVELSRVGGVNAPVGSRDPHHNFPCC